MGFNSFPDFKGKNFIIIIDHWSKKLFLGSELSEIMSLNRFLLLNKFLHLADNKIKNNNKTIKYLNFYFMLRNNWKKFYSTARNSSYNR